MPENILLTAITAILGFVVWLLQRAVNSWTAMRTDVAEIKHALQMRSLVEKHMQEQLESLESDIEEVRERQREACHTCGVLVQKLMNTKTT